MMAVLSSYKITLFLFILEEPLTCTMCVGRYGPSCSKGYGHCNRFTYVQERLNWTSAHAYCKENFNGTLALSGEIEEIRRTCQADLSTVWSAGHTVISRWLAAIGCIYHQQTSQVSTVLDITLSQRPFDAAKCEAFCATAGSNSSLFAIRKRVCTCLDTNTIQTVYDGKCDNFWEGGSNNKDFYTIYRVYNMIVPNDNERAQRLCLSARCSDNNDLSAEACEKSLRMKCKDDFSDRLDWESGARDCWVKTNQFPFPYKDGACARSTDDQWIGLFRNEVFKTQFDGELFFLESCQVVNRVSTAFDECKQQRPFICKTDDNSDIGDAVDISMFCNPINTTDANSFQTTQTVITTERILGTTIVEEAKGTTKILNITDKEVTGTTDVFTTVTMPMAETTANFVMNVTPEKPEMTTLDTKTSTSRTGGFIVGFLVVGIGVVLVIMGILCVICACKSQRKHLPSLPSADELAHRWENHGIELSRASAFHLYADVKEETDIRQSGNVHDYENVPRNNQDLRPTTNQYETLHQYENPGDAYTQLKYDNTGNHTGYI